MAVVMLLCKYLFWLNFSLQTDSPEEMHDWIRDIESKIQDFRGPPKVTLSFLNIKNRDFYIIFGPADYCVVE